MCGDGADAACQACGPKTAVTDVSKSREPCTSVGIPWARVGRATDVVGVPGRDNGAVKEDGVGIPPRWAASDEVPHNVVALDHCPLLKPERYACAAGGEGGWRGVGVVGVGGEGGGQSTMQRWALCRSRARCRRGDGCAHAQLGELSYLRKHS